MPDDKLKLKSRTIYEFLRSDHSTFLVVGLGIEQEANLSAFGAEVVAYREFDTRSPVTAVVSRK